MATELTIQTTEPTTGTDTSQATPAKKRTDRLEIRISLQTALIPFLKETGNPTILGILGRMKSGPTYSGVRATRPEIRKILKIMNTLLTETTGKTNPDLTWEDREEERNSTIHRMQIFIRKLEKGIETLDTLEGIRA
jgi:hypothetical protein